MKVILASFADGPFALRAVGFRSEAESFGLFDEIRVFQLRAFPEAFRRAHGDFMRGYQKGMLTPAIRC
jgi:hypothetical protein